MATSTPRAPSASSPFLHRYVCTAGRDGRQVHSRGYRVAAPVRRAAVSRTIQEARRSGSTISVRQIGGVSAASERAGYRCVLQSPLGVRQPDHRGRLRHRVSSVASRSLARVCWHIGLRPANRSRSARKAARPPDVTTSTLLCAARWMYQARPPPPSAIRYRRWPRAAPTAPMASAISAKTSASAAGRIGAVKHLIAHLQDIHWAGPDHPLVGERPPPHRCSARAPPRSAMCICTTGTVKSGRNICSPRNASEVT